MNSCRPEAWRAPHDTPSKGANTNTNKEIRWSKDNGMVIIYSKSMDKRVRLLILLVVS